MYIDDYKEIPISEHGRKKGDKKTTTAFVSVVIVLYIVTSIVLTYFIQGSYHITYAAKYGGNYETEGLPTGFFITLIFFVGAFMLFGNLYEYLRKKKVCSVSVEGEVLDFCKYPSELNEKKGF